MDMYYYRKMTPEQREQILETRRRKHLPWHSPPHNEVTIECSYLVTAVCYEHKHIISQTHERMTECERELLNTCADSGAVINDWCLLPNHYHILLRTKQLKLLLKALGLFHGRTSFKWNGEDGQRGHKCWFNTHDRYIRSERHFWSSLNYVHNNAVHHGYVDKWQDWPWSSAEEFLIKNGREETMRIWHEYPLLDYGKKWDLY